MAAHLYCQKLNVQLTVIQTQNDHPSFVLSITITKQRHRVSYDDDGSENVPLIIEIHITGELKIERHCMIVPAHAIEIHNGRRHRRIYSA